MTRSARRRAWVLVCGLLALGVLVPIAWRLERWWREYRELQSLLADVRGDDGEAELQAIERLAKLRSEEGAVACFRRWLSSPVELDVRPQSRAPARILSSVRVATSKPRPRAPSRRDRLLGFRALLVPLIASAFEPSDRDTSSRLMILLAALQGQRGVWDEVDLALYEEAAHELARALHRLAQRSPHADIVSSAVYRLSTLGTASWSLQVDLLERGSDDARAAALQHLPQWLRVRPQSRHAIAELAWSDAEDDEAESRAILRQRARLAYGELVELELPNHPERAGGGGRSHEVREVLEALQAWQVSQIERVKGALESPDGFRQWHALDIALSLPWQLFEGLTPAVERVEQTAEISVRLHAAEILRKQRVRAQQGRFRAGTPLTAEDLRCIEAFVREASPSPRR